MAVGAGKSERLVFNDSTAKHEEEWTNLSADITYAQTFTT
jgi:hypothetical protein